MWSVPDYNAMNFEQWLFSPKDKIQLSLMQACTGIRVWFWVTHPSVFVYLDLCIWSSRARAALSSPLRVSLWRSTVEVVLPALTWSLWSSAAFMACSVSLSWHAAPWNMDAVSHRSALQQQNAPVLTDIMMLSFSVHVLHVSSILFFPKVYLCTLEYKYKIAYKYLINTAVWGQWLHPAVGSQ